MATKKDVADLFQQIGTNPTLSTFQDRLRIQKLVYLAEEAFGIDLGFNFTWYINGPYSPDLARVMFDKEQGSQSQLEQEKVEKLKNFVKDFKESSDQLELVGSLHYLLTLAKKEGKSKDYAVQLLEKLKPQFSKADVEKHLPKLTLVT